MIVYFKVKNTYIEVLVDREDLHHLNENRYSVSKKLGGTYYLYDQKLKIYFHRKIMNCPNDRIIDHIDGNSLNNQKNNLRIVTNSQNTFNQKKTKSKVTSRFKGVCFYDRLKFKPWRAYINFCGKRIDLGYYKTEIDAAIAYNNKAMQLMGEFVCLNKF